MIQAAQHRFCTNCGGARLRTHFCTWCGHDFATGGRGTLRFEFRHLLSAVLSPLRHWFNSDMWEQRQVQAFVFFALFPLSFVTVVGYGVTIQSAAWAIGAYFAVLWGSVLWSFSAPGAINTKRLVGIVAFTTIIGMSLDVVLQQLPILRQLYAAADDSSPFFARAAGYILGVGVTEEVVKLVPILWLSFKVRAIATPRQAAFYGGISGLAFGVAEAVDYSLQYTKSFANPTAGHIGTGAYVVAEFVRLISLPLLHAVWCAIASYFVGLACTLAGRKPIAVVVGGIVLAALLHGVYDTFGGTFISLGVAILSILLFVGYSHSSEKLSWSLPATSSIKNVRVEPA